MNTELPLALTDGERRRGLAFLSLAAAFVGFALVLQLSLNSNFLVAEIGVTGRQAGFLEAVRESCGIAAFGILALLAGLGEPLVATLVLLLFGLGLSAYAFVPTYGWVMAMSVVWSQGLHLWMPLPNSMALALAEPDRAGRRLGQVGAAGALGSAAGLALAFALTQLGVKIRPLYLVAGAAALVAALACLGIPRVIRTPKQKLVFRRRYLTYYLLNFLEGWRKQITVAFAGFLLVRVHGATLREMIVLWAGIQAIGYVASPRVGRLIDRIGERRVLFAYYLVVTAMVLCYAFVRSKYVLYAVFVLDSATFALAMAITSYVGRLAPPSERTQTLSMGVAANHVASVAMPLVGGILWTALGYQWAFLLGIPAAAASMVVVARMSRHQVPAAGQGAAPARG
ncbi:MAG TPA: MFS transporter [Desulfobacterales bacterium]|nr:MFS transporter [Desulfobacterales bacterium]